MSLPINLLLMASANRFCDAIICIWFAAFCWIGTIGLLLGPDFARSFRSQRSRGGPWQAGVYHSDRIARPTRWFSALAPEDPAEPASSSLPILPLLV